MHHSFPSVFLVRNYSLGFENQPYATTTAAAAAVVVDEDTRTLFSRYRQLLCQPVSMAAVDASTKRKKCNPREEKFMMGMK
jgi:hypothetical protein